MCLVSDDNQFPKAEHYSLNKLIFNNVKFFLVFSFEVARFGGKLIPRECFG